MCEHTYSEYDRSLLTRKSISVIFVMKIFSEQNTYKKAEKVWAWLLKRQIRLCFSLLLLFFKWIKHNAYDFIQNIYCNIYNISSWKLLSTLTQGLQSSFDPLLLNYSITFVHRYIYLITTVYSYLLHYRLGLYIEHLWSFNKILCIFAKYLTLFIKQKMKNLKD